MSISAFSFIHNSLNGGFPIREAIESVRPFVDEIVVVDMESNDGTRELLESLSIRIIDGVWDYKAGETLANAHALNIHCEHDTILHFEGDEIFEPRLLQAIVDAEENNISVKRLQVEQNFQRIRWYPHWVHRVFQKGSVTKDGETTFEKNMSGMVYLDDSHGYLWDCTNCFREQWLGRVKQQAELRKEQDINSLYVPIHCSFQTDLHAYDGEYFKDAVWTTKHTPLNIPEILKPLVGVTKYEV